MGEVALIGIVIGIPAIFLILFIVNIIKIIKSKKNKIAVKKSLVVKSIIFGTIFLLIVLFYMWIMYSISRAVANM